MSNQPEESLKRPAIVMTATILGAQALSILGALLLHKKRQNDKEAAEREPLL